MISLAVSFLYWKHPTKIELWASHQFYLSVKSKKGVMSLSPVFLCFKANVMFLIEHTEIHTQNLAYEKGVLIKHIKVPKIVKVEFTNL